MLSNTGIREQNVQLALVPLELVTSAIFPSSSPMCFFWHACGVLKRCPFKQRVEGRAQALTPVRQAILDPGRNLVVHHSTDDAVGRQLAKLLYEHFLGHRRNRPFQIRKAQHFAAKEMEYNQQFPTALQNPERILNALSR